jgi:hypothetical protein
MGGVEIPIQLLLGLWLTSRLCPAKYSTQRNALSEFFASCPNPLKLTKRKLELFGTLGDLLL